MKFMTAAAFALAVHPMMSEAAPNSVSEMDPRFGDAVVFLTPQEIDSAPLVRELSEVADAVQLVDGEDGVAVVAVFAGDQGETGVIADTTISDIRARARVEEVSFPYTTNGKGETVSFFVNDVGVLEIGFLGAVWLPETNHLGYMPPRPRPETKAATE